MPAATMVEITLSPGSLRENDSEELLRLYRFILEVTALPHNQTRLFLGPF